MVQIHQPNTDLNLSTTYTTTITTGVKDLDGNTMTSDKKWSFTTSASSSIASLSKATNHSAFSNIESNATVEYLFSNPSNAPVPIVTNSSFDNTESNGSIAPPVNTSSAQATENILTAPSAKGMNNTSLIASTDNTINNNPPIFYL